MQPEELDPVLMANRRARGKRPFFLNDPATERVLSIAMALAGELSVARERIDTLERLLAQRGVLAPGDIDAYEPDAEAQAQRNAWGREYVARILRIVEQDVQVLADEPEPALEDVMNDLGRTTDTPR